MLKDILSRICFYNLSQDASLAPFCTFGAAGNADFMVEPQDVSSIKEIMLACRDLDVPILPLGGGSNVLLSNINGVVILSRKLDNVIWQNSGDDVIVEVGSGYPLKRLVRESFRFGLSGLEFAVGIPGSVGGAVIGNAGVRDFNIGNILLWVESVESDGSCVKIRTEDIDKGYRYSSLSAGVRFLTKCALKLRKNDVHQVKKRCHEHWMKRSSQPFALKSAGCIFKNPEGDFAGRLLEQCGCKGMFIGGAKISELHANFLVNDGTAGVDDIKKLMDKCRAIVYEKKGILLDLEVKVFGF